MTQLESLRAATERRAAAQAEEHLATIAWRSALREAKDAGATERELEQATGLTRQRIWQLLSKS